MSVGRYDIPTNSPIKDAVRMAVMSRDRLPLDN